MSSGLQRATLKPDSYHAASIARAADDIPKLSTALRSRSIVTDDLTIYEAWRRYSDDYCASWLALYPDEDGNVSALLEHLDLSPLPGVR
jgi:hypothetical protein